MVMTTYVGIVKAKMAKPTISPAAQASSVLVGLGGRLNLNPPGGPD